MIAPSHAAAAITAQGVTHFFRITNGRASDEVVRAIDNVSLRVEDRRFISIVGPSGCGKTTLLNIIAGLEELQAGSVNVAGGPPVAGRAEIAFMPARDALMPWRTVEGNAGFGLEVRGVPEAARRPVINELLGLVGLKAFASAKPRQLSQGMRQRVALVRTFALPSRILLMDEPFGALDAQTKQQLQALLLRLWERDHRTVILVTHDLQEAIALSDEVIVMSARPGRIKDIVEVGLKRPRDVATLIADPDFVALYQRVRSQVEDIPE